jgi:hypothetical protein
MVEAMVDVHGAASADADHGIVEVTRAKREWWSEDAVIPMPRPRVAVRRCRDPDAPTPSGGPKMP